MKKKKIEYKTFENKKLQKAVEEEIKYRITDKYITQENKIRSIAAYIAHNFVPKERYSDTWSV